MPIRFVDRAATVVGRLTTTLANFAADIDGTFTAAAARTGSIAAQLQDHVGTLAGQFQSNANRVGTIASTLEGVTGRFLSGQSVVSDWPTLINGRGVSWYHDFVSQAELDAFRWMNNIGNDPTASGASAGNAQWVQGGGPSGSNYIKFLYPAGVSPPSTFWWRPLAPMNTGSGKAQNDPAVGGALTVRNWTPSASHSTTSNFAFGWYGNALYANADPSHFDGTEFYCLIHLKADPRRITGGNQAFTVGKFVWFTTAETANSLSGGEHVIWSYGNGGNQGTGRNYIRVYVHQTTGIGAFDPLDQEEPGTRIQPGSDSANDAYYTGGWDRLLVNIRPGQVGVTSGANSTRLRQWFAPEGATQYTKIWDQEYGISSYEARNGLQALILSPYNNGADFPQDFEHSYARVLFSQEFIDCTMIDGSISNPLVTAALALAPGANTTTIGGNAGNTGFTAEMDETLQWINRAFYDHNRQVVHMIGKNPTSGSPSVTGVRTNSYYDCATNAWQTSGFFNINGVVEGGHIYESFAYAPEHREIFTGRWNTSPTQWQRWTWGDALNDWDSPAFTAPWAMSMTNAHQPVCVWHPHLFGVNDGGLVSCRLTGGQGVAIVAWRRSVNTWSTLVTTTASGSNPHLGAGVYVRASRHVVFTLATGNTYTIGMGSDGTPATPVQISNPPIACKHVGEPSPAGSFSPTGILIEDPALGAGPYILEKSNSTARVWKYISGAWSLRPYSHPFPNGSPTGDTLWCVAALWPLGAYMCIRSSLTNTVRVWRPND